MLRSSSLGRGFVMRRKYFIEADQANLYAKKSVSLLNLGLKHNTY